MRLKRGFALCLAVVMMLAMAVGCSTKKAEPENGAKANADKPAETAQAAETAKPAADPVTIRVFLSDNLIVSKPVTEEFVTEFEAKNPDVKVKLETVPASQIDEKMRIMMSTDDMADVYQLQVNSDLAKLMDTAGYIYDLKQLEASKNFSEKVQAQLSYNGKMVDFALGLGVLGFLYNKQMFADVGFSEPPKTWEELMEAGKKLKDKNKALLVYSGKWPTGPAVNFHWAFGNYALQDPEFEKAYKSASVDWTKPEYNALLQDGFVKFNELNQYVLVGSFTNEYEQARQAFVQGQAAMMMGGSWDAGATDGLKPNFEWGFMNLPYAPADRNSTVYTVEAGIGMNAKSDHLEATKKFMEYLFSKETYAKINKAKKSLSPFPGVGEVDPRYEDASKRLETNLVMPFANAGPMSNALLMKLGQIAQGVTFGEDVKKSADAFIKEYNLVQPN